MNKETIRNIIKIYLQKINVEGREELESYIDISLDEILIDILESVYENNINTISSINCDMDNTDDYIFKDINGEYSLDIFLINRLLKNVGSMKFEEQTFIPESHYDPDCREILIDLGRFKNLNKDQKRKLIYHEFLHALKTDFYNAQFFQSKEYFELKEIIKQIYPNLVNDFAPKTNLPDGIYDIKKHTGLKYGRRNDKSGYNADSIDDVDEMANESDSIILSKDNTCATLRMKDSNRMLLVYNPESSNVSITNYGFLLISMLNKKIMFLGQYLEPCYLIDYFNELYTDIFQSAFNVNDTAWNIFSTIICNIKHEQTEKLNTLLLDTIYKCIKYKNELLEKNGYESKLKQDIGELRKRGLIEQKEGGGFKVASIVQYNVDESENSSSNQIKK